MSIFINDRIGVRDTMFILGFAFLSTMSSGNKSVVQMGFCVKIVLVIVDLGCDLS